MLIIKTASELKRKLPEVLDRIDHCKFMYDIHTNMLKNIQEWCIDECVNGTDYGWFTTKEAYTEIYKAQMIELAEIDYLQGLLNKLQNYKHIYF